MSINNTGEDPAPLVQSSPFDNSNTTTRQTVFLLSPIQQLNAAPVIRPTNSLFIRHEAGLVEVSTLPRRFDFQRSIRGPAILVGLFLAIYLGISIGKIAMESGAFESFASFYLGTGGSNT